MVCKILYFPIGRSAHSKGLYFTYEDWQDNVNKGLRAHLIYFPDILLKNILRDIKNTYVMEKKLV